MRDYLFQIVVFLAGALIGIIGEIAKERLKKWIARILAVLLIAISLIWVGYELGQPIPTPEIAKEGTPPTDRPTPTVQPSPTNTLSSLTPTFTVPPLPEETPPPTPAPTSTPTYTPVPPTPTNTPTPTSTPTPTPTPRPLPFEDNFDMGPRPEWEPTRGMWRMVDGTYTADPSDAWSLTFVGDAGWTDYAVDVDVLFYDWNYPVRIIVRAQDGSYMALETNCCDTDLILVREGSSHGIAHSDEGGLTGGIYWHKNHLKIEVKGTTYTAYSDGTMLLRVQDASFASGRVGLAFRYRHENTTRFDNLRVTELR